MARRLVCTPSSVAFIVRSQVMVFMVWSICISLVVLGVFFAINAEIGASSSNYTISVAASVIVFVVFALMACCCAPLTFSTEFEADAKRKLIRYDATFLGCISWRSMCSTCKFQDVLEVVIRPAGKDKHRVELHLNAAYGTSETNRIIYVTDEVPAEEDGVCVLVKKLLDSWCSCCFGLPEASGPDGDEDANHPARDEPQAAGQPPPAAADNDDGGGGGGGGASQHSRTTRNIVSAAQVDAPLPPSHLIVETVKELQRVLDSVKVEQDQSVYAVAKVAEISTGVPMPPPSIDRQLTKTGVLLPDVPRPKGPNSVRPRLPSALTAPSLASDDASFAGDGDLSPWGDLSVFEGAGSERAMPGRLPPMLDRLSVATGSLRGGSLVSIAPALFRSGSVSSVGSSVATESLRPVFQRRAPSAARNAPAAMAADPSLAASSAAPPVARPAFVFSPAATSSAPPVLQREPSFTLPVLLPLTLTSNALAPPAVAAVSSPDVRTLSVHEAAADAAAPAAAFPSFTFAHMQSQDASGSPVTQSLSAASEVAPGPSSASSAAAASPSNAQLSDASIASAAAIPLSIAPQSPSTSHLLFQPPHAQRVNMVQQASTPSEDASNTAVLERILSSVSASNLLSRFINDYIDDGDLGALAVTKPAKLMAKYGLNESQIAAFVAGCRQSGGSHHDTQQHLLPGDQRPHQDTSAAFLSAAGNDSFAPRPPGANASAAQLPRARPPLPPLPSGFGT